MKNYLNKSAFKGIKSELTVKYGVSKSDEIWKYANSEYHKIEIDEPDAVQWALCQDQETRYLS